MSVTIKDEGTVFFTSDLHFHHKNIVEYSGRPWTTETQTEEIIKRWNNRVGPTDHVFHLGDFSFSHHKQIGRVRDIIRELQGIHYYIGGNHCDRGLWSEIASDELPWVEYVGSYLEARIGENRQKICMFHYPMEVWNGMHHGAWHLHGHCHGSLPAVGKRLDVGLDNHPDFQVFSWAEVKKHMDAQEIVYKDHHKER